MNDSRLERSVSVAQALHSAYMHRAAVFSDTTGLLEHQVPDGVVEGSREHANFLFFLISQDHGTKSALLYERAKRSYRDSPSHFDPASIVQNHRNPADLLVIVRPLGVRYPAVAARGWYLNAQRLMSDFRGDARKLFDEADTAQVVMSRIKSFFGFGPKTGGLLFRVFVGTGLGKVRDTVGVDFPTDVHDTRIAAMTGIAEIPSEITSSNYMQYVRVARETWRRAAQLSSINWLQLDRALWLLGSRGCTTGRHSDCPLRHHCTKGEHGDGPEPTPRGLRRVGQRRKNKTDRGSCSGFFPDSAS